MGGTSGNDSYRGSSQLLDVPGFEIMICMWILAGCSRRQIAGVQFSIFDFHRYAAVMRLVKGHSRSSCRLSSWLFDPSSKKCEDG